MKLLVPACLTLALLPFGSAQTQPVVYEYAKLEIVVDQSGQFFYWVPPRIELAKGIKYNARNMVDLEDAFKASGIDIKTADHIRAARDVNDLEFLEYSSSAGWELVTVETFSKSVTSSTITTMFLKRPVKQ